MFFSSLQFVASLPPAQYRTCGVGVVRGGGLMGEGEIVIVMHIHSRRQWISRGSNCARACVCDV